MAKPKEVSMFLWLHLQNFWDFLKRFPVGKFWFFVGELPKGAEGITIPGDPDAVPRRDPRWRDQWKWVVLTTKQSTDYYYLFFESVVEGRCMRYWLKFNTPGVAVRVGPGDVTFVAHTTNGDDGISLPLCIHLGLDEKRSIEEELKRSGQSHLVTWV